MIYRTLHNKDSTIHILFKYKGNILNDRPLISPEMGILRPTGQNRPSRFLYDRQAKNWFAFLKSCERFFFLLTPNT